MNVRTSAPEYDPGDPNKPSECSKVGTCSELSGYSKYYQCGEQSGPRL